MNTFSLSKFGEFASTYIDNDSSGHPFSVAGVVIIRETDLFATCVLIEATAAAAA